MTTYRKLHRLVYVLPGLVAAEVALAVFLRGAWIALVALVGLLVLFQLIASGIDASTTIAFTSGGELVYAQGTTQIRIRAQDVGRVEFAAATFTGGVRSLPQFAAFRITLRSADVMQRPRSLLLSRFGWTNSRALFGQLDEWLGHVATERIAPEARRESRSQGTDRKPTRAGFRAGAPWPPKPRRLGRGWGRAGKVRTSAERWEAWL